MAKPRRGTIRAALGSFAIHLAAVVMLFGGIKFTHEKIAPAPPAHPVIKAVAVDARKVDARIKARLDAERKKVADKIRRAEQQRAAKAKKIEERKRRERAARKQRELKAQKQRDLKAKKQRDLKAKKQRELEAKKQRDLEAKKQRDLEAKKQRDLKAKKQRDLEAKKQRELEAQKQREQEAQKQREQDLRAALEEEARIRAALEARDLARIENHMARIAAAISAAWIYPPQSQRGLSCTLYIRMDPFGDVVESRIIRSSGNQAFDRQAEEALYRAAPLPLPEDPRLNEKMREIQFDFAPE